MLLKDANRSRMLSAQGRQPPKAANRRRPLAAQGRQPPKGGLAVSPCGYSLRFLRFW